MASQQIFKSSYSEELRRNVANNLELYNSSSFEYDRDRVFYNTQIRKPDKLELKLPDDTRFYDAENAEILYAAYKHLTPLQASDTRLWTYLAHVDLYKYMSLRWSDVRDGAAKKPAEYILDHWFISSPTQSNLLRHGLAGLWWAAHLSYDGALEDPFELTRILYRQLDLATRTLGTYNLARYKPAVHGILGFIKDNPDLFRQRFEAKQRFITKYLNQIGGVKPLSFFDEAFFTERLESVRDRINSI